MNDFLNAADGYVPLISTVVWVGFIGLLVFKFRIQVRGILQALRERIAAGAELKMGPLEVGKLVKSTSDVSGEIKTFGDPDQLKLLFKAQGAGWKKSTKGLALPNGCLIQVTTERQSASGDWASAEAVVFVPDVAIKEDENGLFSIVAK